VFSLIHFLFFETLKNSRKTGNKQGKTNDLFFDTLRRYISNETVTEKENNNGVTTV